MEEGGKLVAFLVIGMVLITAAAFIFLIQQPNLPDNIVDPLDVDEFEQVSPIDKIIPIIPPKDVDDEEDEDADDDEEDNKKTDDDDKDDTSTTSKTYVKCSKGQYLSNGVCLSCADKTCRSDLDCYGCGGTECYIEDDKTVGKCVPNILLDILFNHAIPLALLISYLIVALAFMVSKIFSSREAETWAKIELREVLISTMYAAIIISFIPIFNILADDFSKRYTGYSVDEMFIQVIDNSFIPIKSTINYLFTFASLSWVGWNPTGVIGIPWMPKNVVDISYSHFYDGKGYLNIFSLFAHTFIPILFSAMVSVMGQIIVLNFLEQTLFVFIGLGLVMRSFTFTRKMGGTLLAVILGVFILFKLLLVIESTIYLNMGLDAKVEIGDRADFKFLDFVSKAISILMDGILQLFECLNLPLYIYKFVVDCSDGNPMLYFPCFILSWLMWLIDIIISVVKIGIGVIFWAVTLIIVLMMGVVTLTDVVDYVIINSIATYSDLLTFAFFMPVLNFIIIIAGVKSLAETFGGDASVVNMLTFI